MANYTNGFGHLRVEVLESPEVPFRTFWTWFRQTWLSLHNQEYDPDNPEHLQACRDVANRRALPTPMEAINVQVRIWGLSRVGLAQITRGRVGWAYNVESQMPQHIKHAVTIPKNIYEHPEYGERARTLAGELQQLYNDMYDDGVPPQDCRYLTLHGQQTSMVLNVNYAALLGYFARRCENGLTDELNLVGRLLRHELIKKHLNQDGDDALYGSGWSFLISKFDAMGGDNVCLNNDRVFGNTGRSPSAGDWVPSLVNGTCDYDFSKSAWYFELQELPDHLLFPGENEMVEDFRRLGFRGRLHKLDNAQGKDD